MHIPDGFLNGPTAAAAGALSAAALAVAVRQAHVHLPRRKVPLMGLSAAFVFAAMMINFPVVGGTSGHLVGGVLCAVLLGPSAAVLVITCVLILQSFVFADGGVLALGGNIFNMAVVCSVGGYYVYRGVYALLPNARGRLVAVAFASWLATVAAAIVCAGELALSGTVPFAKGFPAMALTHMLIGLGEALITTLVISTIVGVRPDLLESRAEGQSRRYGQVLVFGGILALGLALFVAPFACHYPDGLERVLINAGFNVDDFGNQQLPAPLPDYKFAKFSNTSVATAIAGGIGTVLAFVLSLGLAYVLVPRRKDKRSKPNAAAGQPSSAQSGHRGIGSSGD